MTRLRRRAAVALLAGLALVLPLGCGALDPGPSPTSSRTAASPLPVSPAPASPSAAPTPPDGRPLEPVPGVVAPGITDPPAGAGLARYTGQQLDWSRCSDRMQCAVVSAPLDWSAPDGRALTLVAGRVRATRSPRLGSLFINPGGPGGSGLGLLAGFPTAGLEQWDLVSWDPRGVGRSTPVRCSSDAGLDRLFSIDSSPDDDAEASAYNSAVEGFGEDCLARSGALLEHISTADTVRDLDLLRGLVGDARLNWLGFSYGTQIGAQYADTFPDRTGSMVLDGAVDLNDASDVDQLEGFELALGHFATSCAAQRCTLGADQRAVLATIKRLLGDLDARPLPGIDGRPLTQQLAVSGVVTPLYDGTKGWPLLRGALEQAVTGQGAQLMALADAGNERGADGRYGSIATAFPAIRCLDSQDASVATADRRAAALVAKAPVLGPYAGADVVCPLWPVAPAPKPPRLHRVGNRPVVVIGTTGDPATPYPYAVSMARQLDSAVLVTREGEGHTAYSSSPCVRTLVQDYLNRGVVPEDGVRCPSG